MIENDDATSRTSQCGNCRALLAGPHCHRCGQPVKGLIRPLSGWIADFFDSVFNYDGRLPRTMVPLLLRPGFLTQEYIAGRRVRYVTPVRLFLFLTIALFLAIQLVADFGLDGASVNLRPDAGDTTRIERIVAWLPEGEREDALQAALRPPPATSSGVIQIDGLEDGAPDPVALSWLSDGLNAQLDAAVQHLVANLRRINENPAAFFKQMLSMAPQTLFFMLPLFALLLKLFYVFRRRLYMEHLLVALHSHAFIALTLLIIVAISALSTRLAGTPWLAGALDWIVVLAWIWIPVNLFITQKRVYAQGWTMTTLKFTVIGILYQVLLVFGSLLALLLALLFW